MNEDIHTNVTIITREAISNLIGGGFWIPGTAMSLHDGDVAEIDFLLHVMRACNHDIVDTMASLDDLCLWSIIHEVRKDESDYAPIFGSGSVSPYDALQWVRENGNEEFGWLRVHFIALNALYWAQYIARTIEGMAIVKFLGRDEEE